jgi:hypothetical protein
MIQPISPAMNDLPRQLPGRHIGQIFNAPPSWGRAARKLQDGERFQDVSAGFATLVRNNRSVWLLGLSPRYRHDYRRE